MSIVEQMRMILPTLGLRDLEEGCNAYFLDFENGITPRFECLLPEIINYKLLIYEAEY